jgi:hypothetical protein
MQGPLRVMPRLPPAPEPRLPPTLSQAKLAVAQLRARQLRRARIVPQSRQAFSMVAPLLERVERVGMPHPCNTHAAANRPSRRNPRDTGPNTVVPRLSHIVADPRHTVGKGNSLGNLTDRAHTSNRSVALATQAARMRERRRRRRRAVPPHVAAPRCRWNNVSA